MRQLVAVSTMALTAGILAAGSPGMPARVAACTSGPATLAGADVHVWCGPAKATVHVAGKAYHFSHGQCLKTEGFTAGTKVLAVNIGTQTLPPSSPKASYFGVLTDKAKDGRYANQAVSWQVPGKGFAVLTNKVIVSARLERGTFSGKALMRIGGKLKDVGVATGSWSC